MLLLIVCMADTRRAFCVSVGSMRIIACLPSSCCVVLCKAWQQVLQMYGCFPFSGLLLTLHVVSHSVVVMVWSGVP